MKIELIGIDNFPLIKENDNLPEIIYDTLKKDDIKLQDDDILVLAETVLKELMLKLKMLNHPKKLMLWLLRVKKILNNAKLF